MASRDLPTKPDEKVAGQWGLSNTPSLLTAVPYITVIPTASSFCLATSSRWVLARLIFDPEDGGDTILQNVGSYTD
jgi:hypothetical protein